MNSVFNKPFGSFHYDMVKKLINPKKAITIILLPRGFGKSVIASMLIPVWLIIFRMYKLIVLSSMSGPKAKELVEDCQKTIESERFKKFFGDLKKEDGRWSADMMDLYSEELGIDARIIAKGAGMQFTGTRYYDTRPQLVILDDCEDLETVENPDTIDKLERWVNSIIKPALDNGKKSHIFIIGTTFKADSMITRIAKYKRGVEVIKYPCWATNEAMAKKLKINVRQSIWESNPKFTTEKLNLMREEAVANGTIASFMSQYLLDPRSDHGMGFRERDIRIFLPSEVKTSDMNLYMLVDVALSKKKYSDKSGIIVAGMTADNSIYVFKAFQGRWGNQELVNKMCEVEAEYHLQNLRGCFIESYAFGFINPLLRLEQEKRGISFAVRELEHKARKKEDRIRALIPFVEARKLHIRPEHGDLKTQFMNYHGEADQRGLDLLDALAYLLDVGYKPKKDTAEVDRKRDNRRAWEDHVRAHDRHGDKIGYRFSKEKRSRVEQDRWY